MKKFISVMLIIFLVLTMVSLCSFVNAEEIEETEVQNTEVQEVSEVQETKLETTIETVEESSEPVLETTEEVEEPVETVVVEKTVIDEINEALSDNERLEIENKSLIELVDALREELSQEKVNMNRLAKILITLGGSLAIALIALLIRLIRIRIKNLDKEEVLNAAKELNDKRFADYQVEIKNSLNSLEEKMIKKIDDAELKRKKEAEAQSLKLKETVEEAKKNLKINDVLDNI